MNENCFKVIPAGECRKTTSTKKAKLESESFNLHIATQMVNRFMKLCVENCDISDEHAWREMISCTTSG